MELVKKSLSDQIYDILKMEILKNEILEMQLIVYIKMA